MRRDSRIPNVLLAVLSLLLLGVSFQKGYLDKYKGHSFVTNYQSAYVSIFTGEWAIYHSMAGVTPGHFPQIDEVSRSYIFERDVLTNPQKYNHPDYAVMVGADHPGLSQGFPLVERGKDYWIYDLRGSKP